MPDNHRHRSNADKRAAVNKLLDDPRTAKLIDREIARLAGVSRTMVQQIRMLRKGHVAPSRRK